MMERIGNIPLQIGSAQQTPPTSAESPPLPRAPRSLMAKFWVAMTEMYGERFTRNYGDAPPDSWAIALAPFGASEFREAVRRCMKRPDPGRVPTLPEIVQYCEMAKPRHYPALPHKEIDDAQRERNRRNIREILRGLGVQKA